MSYIPGRTTAESALVAFTAIFWLMTTCCTHTTSHPSKYHRRYPLISRARAPKKITDQEWESVRSAAGVARFNVYKRSWDRRSSRGARSLHSGLVHEPAAAGRGKKEHFLVRFEKFTNTPQETLEILPIEYKPLTVVAMVAVELDKAVQISTYSSFLWMGWPQV